MSTAEVAETVQTTDANALYPCPDDRVGSRVRFAHRPMVLAALTVAKGVAGLTGGWIVLAASLAVGFSGQESALPVHNGRSSPPSRVKVSPVFAYVGLLDMAVITGNDTLTTLSLTHVHVANVTPTVRNNVEHGQDGVTILALSVFESKVTKMTCPRSDIRTVAIEGASSGEADCNTLTATLAFEYKAAPVPDRERDTVQLAAAPEVEFAER